MEFMVVFIKEQWYLLLLSAAVVAVLQYMIWQAVKPSGSQRRTKDGSGVRAAKPGGKAVREGNIGACIVDAGSAQDIGDRERQEDSCGFAGGGEQIGEKGPMAILGDGMGGLSGGNQISRFSVEEARAIYEGLTDGIEVSKGLEDIIREVNRQAYAAFNKTGGRTAAGTTLILAHIYHGRLYWAAAGDSRLYLLRKGSMYCLTEDHSYLNEQYLRCMSKEELKARVESDERSGLLTSYIGQPALKHVDVGRRGLPLEKGDRIVLCSDGIYRSLGEEELAGLAGIEEEHQTCHLAGGICEGIVRAVKEKRIRGQDNMTVLLMIYGGERA